MTWSQVTGLLSTFLGGKGLLTVNVWLSETMVMSFKNRNSHKCEPDSPIFASIKTHIKKEVIQYLSVDLILSLFVTSESTLTGHVGLQ